MLDFLADGTYERETGLYRTPAVDGLRDARHASRIRRDHAAPVGGRLTDFARLG